MNDRRIAPTLADIPRQPTGSTITIDRARYLDLLDAETDLEHVKRRDLVSLFAAAAGAGFVGLIIGLFLREIIIWWGGLA